MFFQTPNIISYVKLPVHPCNKCPFVHCSYFFYRSPFSLNIYTC